MKRLRPRRPSASMIVAMVALVAALGGSASAGVPAHIAKLLSGSKIKKHSISGNRIRNNTLTGVQIRESKLGKVPLATLADKATSATSATNATNATNATKAASAAGLDGLTRWRTTVASPGADSTSPTTATLATVGPFTILGECYISGAATVAGTFIKTSQDGSYAQGYSGNDYSPLNVSDGAVQISADTASGSTATHTPDFTSPDDGSWAAESPDGSLTLDGFGNQGVYLQGASGPACSFSGFLLTE